MQACKEISFSLRALRFTATLQGTDIGLVVEHAFGQFTCFSPNRLLLGVLIAFYKSVRLAAGLRVRLPSGLSPFVSLLVGHCVRLVSRFFPFVSIRLVSLLYPFVSGLFFLLLTSASFCFRSCWSLCLPCLPSVSLCFSCWSVLRPFCFLLSPFLLVIVSALSSFLFPFLVTASACCLPSVSFCFPSCWSLCPFCLFLLVSHVAKNGLGNAFVLFHLYAGVVFGERRWPRAQLQSVHEPTSRF